MAIDLIIVTMISVVPSTIAAIAALVSRRELKRSHMEIRKAAVAAQRVERLVKKAFEAGKQSERDK